MNRKAENVAGYRLHKERVLFSGGKIIRTIKYPLVPKQNDDEESRAFLEQFRQAVIRDDLKVRGDLNLNDYLQSLDQNISRYTLFDFWRDSLRAGVVWASKTASLIDFVGCFYPSFSFPVDVIWENASKTITTLFDKEKFKEVLLSDPVRSTTTKGSFERRLLGFLKDEFKKKEGKTFLVTSPEAGEVINFIVGKFFNADGNLILNGAQQEEFWRKEFGLDKREIERRKPTGELKDITFLIIPELISDLSSAGMITEFISRRKEWLEKKLPEEKEEGKDERLEKILGLTDNFNGFSNYYGKALKALQEGKKEAVFDALKTLLPSLSDSRSEVMASLSFLSVKAKELSSPSLPSISSWADYRSAFGGKIQSWFSNATRREKELGTQIENFKKSLEEAEEYLDKAGSLPEEAKVEKEEIIQLFDRLKDFFLKTNNTIKEEKDYEIFDSLLSALKRRLNFFYQAYLSAEDEGWEKVSEVPAFNGLYKRIYKPVAFFGETSRQKNKKYIEKTISTLEDGEVIIKKTLLDLRKGFSPEEAFREARRKNETEEIVYRRFLQFFWDKYQNKAINTSFFREKYGQILKAASGDSFWEELLKKNNQGRYVFYRSIYNKGTLTQIELKGGAPLNDFSHLVLGLVDFILSCDRETLLKDGDFFLDWIELAKHLIASLLRFNSKEEFSFAKFNLTNFERASNYLELFSLKDVKKNEFSFLLQSLILAEIKGAATLYSKREYTAKYTIQIIGSDKKFPLFYQPLDPDINLQTSRFKTKQLMKPHHYLLSLGKIRPSYRQADKPNLIHIEKGSYKTCFVSPQEQKYLFRLSSSPYQLQFLDKYFYRPEGWENITSELKEWSFVVEENYKICWDLETKRPRFLAESNSRKNKIYLALPFQLGRKGDKQANSKLGMIAGERENYPFLGIDVGEYGLAYCLVSFPDKTIKLEETGFLYDQNIANIKDRFAQIQQQARKGAFSEKDTVVSRVRENAVGALRNKTHVVLTKDKGASIIYEFSISNFETGSGRTTAIYNSVKRADVELQSDADKQIHNHVWGGYTKLPGTHLSAFASSYTCSGCGRSLYQLTKNELLNSEIVEREGNIVNIKTPLGEIRGYAKDSKYRPGFKFSSNENSLKEFRKIIKDFARPPVGEKSEVMAKFAQPYLAQPLEKLKSKRGNSFIFVCPFADCHLAVDADLQAAFMMALRGYLKFSRVVLADGEKGKLGVGESYLKATAKFLAGNKLDFEPRLAFNPFDVWPVIF